MNAGYPRATGAVTNNNATCSASPEIALSVATWKRFITAQFTNGGKHEYIEVAVNRIRNQLLALNLLSSDVYVVSILRRTQ